MTINAAGTDRQILTTQAYATDDNLRIRYETHERYTVPQLDFKNWVLDTIAWRGDEWVLDLGAGPGTYFEPVRMRIPDGRHFAGDLSFGMIRRQQENASGSTSILANFDAQAIPYADNTFDVVLANHMLYHVPDIDAALKEIQRVLKPTGVLIAATNSINNMPELTTLYRRALLLLTNFKYKEDLPEPVVTNFSLENATFIAGRHFYAAARHDLPSALIFPEAEPVVRYLDSMRALREPGLPEGITWESYLDVMRQQVIRLIDHSGRLAVRKLAGVIVATDAGDFVTDFVSKLKATGG